MADLTSKWRWPFKTRGTVSILLLGLLLTAAVFAVRSSTQPQAARSAAAVGRPLIPFTIAAVAVSNPEKPPSDEQKPGGVLGYALYRGLFQAELEKAGFDFQGIRGFPRTAACMLALSSGQVDVASTGDSPAVLSRARGDKHRAIYVTLPTTETWIVARKGGPRSFAELGGQRLGTLLGSTFDYYFRVAAERVHVENVQFSQLLASAALPALQNNALDAYLTTATNAALWQKKYGLPVIARLTDIDKSLRGIGITTARSEFLDAHPEFAAAYFRGIKAALDAIEQDREAYLVWEEEATGTPLDILRESFALRNSDTPAPEESVHALEEQLAFRLKTGVANNSFNVREWIVGAAPQRTGSL